jgi:tRNA G18 (ribose-2'-O)-methylase SpoU
MEARFAVRTFDSPLSPGEYQGLPKNPVTVVLDNLRSAYNVGSVFRTADAARIERVIACGYTARPPHLKVSKTALGTDQFVKSEHAATAAGAVRRLRQDGTTVVALETADNVKLYSEYQYPRPVALVVGNEALGVSREALAEVNDVVQIPLFGYKNSLNVVCAFAVVLYEILRQWRFDLPGRINH